MASGAAWHGATQVLQSATLGKGGTWVVNADSRVQDMSMRGGRVEFQAPAPEASYKTLTLQTLDGNGVFVLNTNVAAGQNDQLRVTGRADGQHRVLVRNAGGEADSRGARLGLVHTQGRATPPSGWPTSARRLTWARGATAWRRIRRRMSGACSARARPCRGRPMPP